MNLSHSAIIDKIRSVPKLIFTDDFEISIQEMELRNTGFVNGEPLHHRRQESIRVALRLQHQKRPGRATLLYHDESSVAELVEMAFDASKQSSPDPWFRFPIWRTQRVQAPSDALSSTDFNAQTPPESSYSKLIWRPDRLEEGLESWRLKTSVFRKTERQPLEYAQSGQSVTYGAHHRAGEIAFRMNAARSAPFGKLESEASLEELLRGLYYRRGGRVFSGTISEALMLGSQPVAEILRALAPLFRADRMQQGTSPLYGREGRLAASCVDIVDDPTHERAGWRAPYDLEGSPTQRTKLVERGEITSLLYDVYTATRENRLSTGHFQRRLLSEDTEIAPWHLMWQPGEASPEALFKEMGEGLFIDHCAPLEADPAVAGRYRLRGMGWRVSQGSPAEPIWYIDFMVDLFDLLRRVVSSGKATTFFGRHAAPSILIANLPLEK